MKASGLELANLTPTLGVECKGIDLTQPQSESTYETIMQAWYERGLLLFRDQRLDPDAHVAFTRQFGEFEIHIRSEYLLPDYPEILVVGNPRENGRLVGHYIPGDGDWHSDLSYCRIPSMASLMYAVKTTPEGGETEFAAATAAYAALPAATKLLIEGLRAVHDYPWFDDKLCAKEPGRKPLSEEKRGLIPPVSHPIARTHPVTHRKSIYVCPDLIRSVEGMPGAKGRALCTELGAHTTQTRFTYSHRWREGDLIVWDNRCLMHRARAFDDQRYVRVMHRTTVKGDIPF